MQSPRHVSAFLRAVHAHRPVTLREDFCGSAALSRRWLEDAAALGENAVAIAVDLDSDAIARAAAAVADDSSGIRFVCADSTKPTTPETSCDVVFVGNFSIGYLHTRHQLVDYLTLSRSRLLRGNTGDGVFVCDTYGGASAFQLGSHTRKHPGPGGETIHYHWQHEAADPLTSMVTNSISFRVEVEGEIVQELPRAFVYRWRLWSIAELRDAMLDAGFVSTEVYADCNPASGHTPTPVAPEGLLDDWTVLVVGRTASPRVSVPIPRF